MSTGLQWNVVTSASNPVTLVAENGYIPKGAGAVNFILPAAATIGDTYIISGYGNLWTLAQNAGQTIYLGTSHTTTGATGSITATSIKDSIELVCVTTNNDWNILTAIGNLTIV